MKFADPRRSPATLLRPLATAAALSLTLAACGSGPSADAPRAVAQVMPLAGSNATGNISFTQQGGSVRVVARVTGLKPNQEHGFHVHEKGDCSAPDGMSAGGHFNPTAQPHGAPGAAHHGGDMPSLKADGMGNADMRFVIEGVTLGSGATDLIGKAVIVHAQPDDYTTQPTGNSGGRIACGVIAASTGAGPAGMPMAVPKPM